MLGAAAGRHPTAHLGGTTVSPRRWRIKGSWDPVGRLRPSRAWRRSTAHPQRSIVQHGPSEQNFICDLYQAPPGVPAPFRTGMCAAAELAYTRPPFVEFSLASRMAESRRRIHDGTQAEPARRGQHEGGAESLRPVDMAVCPGDLNSQRSAPRRGPRHLVVGWVDNSSGPAGVIGSSRTVGDSFGTNGFGEMAYANATRQDAYPGDERGGRLHGHHVFQRRRRDESGQLSYRNAAIATWTGSNNSTWSTSATHDWSIGGSTFTWVNQEVGRSSMARPAIAQSPSAARPSPMP